MRWPEAYEFRFAEEAQLRDRRLLFPDVLNRKWHEARAQAVSLSFGYAPQPSPEHLFSSILRSAHEDVLLLTAALLLSWTVNEKHSTDIGARTASGILRRESIQDHSFSGREREFGFRSLFLHFLRLRVAGERFEQDSYASHLDALVETLDSMTERPVVPGRAYAPSTLHDRQGLRFSTVAVLAATAPPEGDDGLIERVRTLAMDEHLLPYGDRSLRSVVDELSAWRSTIEDQTHTQVTRGASLLLSGQDYDSLIAKLQIIVASAEETIESERVARMTSRPIDAAKLERLRVAVETDLLSGLTELSYFREFELEAVVGEERSQSCEVPFSQVRKAWLTDPPMESSPINFEEYLVSGTRKAAARTVWNAFIRRSRTRWNVSAWGEEEMFWSEIAPLIMKVGPDPALVVSRSAEGRTLRRSRHAARDGQPKIRKERRSELQGFPPYVGTFEGVDVFDGDFPARKAWLFSSKDLLCVGYIKKSAASHYVDVSYEPSDDRIGTLRFRFHMSCKWRNSPIFELHSTERQDS